jgi:hypothetical protein
MVWLGLLTLSFALYPTSYPTVLITSHPTLLSFLLLGGPPHSVPVPSCTPTGFSLRHIFTWLSPSLPTDVVPNTPITGRLVPNKCRIFSSTLF